MNIGIISLGRVSWYGHRASRCNGDLERVGAIRSLSLDPEVESIILLSASDYSSLNEPQLNFLDPNRKVNDVFTKKRCKPPKYDNLTDAQQYKAVQRLTEAMMDEVEPDLVLGFFGVVPPTTLPGFRRKIKPPHDFIKLLSFIYYSVASSSFYLSATNVPWVAILPDPRGWSPTGSYRDMPNAPRAVLAQYTGSQLWTSIPTFDASHRVMVTHEVPMVYAAIEKLNLVAQPTLKAINPNPSRSFVVAAMQSAQRLVPKDTRMDVLEEWVIPYDAEIYGEWEPWRVVGKPMFKGYLKSDDLDELFGDVATTLLIPVLPDWVTAKYAEMARIGVCPIIHPSYDTQGHVFPADHPLRVSCPEEMAEKVEQLCANPTERVRLVEDLRDREITPFFDGKWFSELVKSQINLC